MLRDNQKGIYSSYMDYESADDATDHVLKMLKVIEARKKDFGQNYIIEENKEGVRHFVKYEQFGKSIKRSVSKDLRSWYGAMVIANIDKGKVPPKEKVMSDKEYKELFGDHINKSFYELE